MGSGGGSKTATTHDEDNPEDEQSSTRMLFLALLEASRKELKWSQWTRPHFNVCGSLFVDYDNRSVGTLLEHNKPVYIAYLSESLPTL